jgi:hypothetical protein
MSEAVSLRCGAVVGHVITAMDEGPAEHCAAEVHPFCQGRSCCAGPRTVRSYDDSASYRTDELYCRAMRCAMQVAQRVAGGAIASWGKNPTAAMLQSLELLTRGPLACRVRQPVMLMVNNSTAHLAWWWGQALCQGRSCVRSTRTLLSMHSKLVNTWHSE